MNPDERPRNGLEAKRLADVLAGRPEDLPVDVHLVSSPESETVSPRPSDGSRDGVPPRVSDPLMQVEVADGMCDDGRAEHLFLYLLDELP
jgi:hypothetical protein